MEEEIQSVKRRIYWYVPRIPVLLAIALIGLAASLVCLFLLNQAQALFSGAHKSLLLTPQQIAQDQQSPPFGFQFPAHSFANTFPVFTWWLAITLLGLGVFPLVFSSLRGLADRGYIFSKTLGILLLAYLAWMLANMRLLAFSHLSMVIVTGMLCAAGAALLFWQRGAIRDFLRLRWRFLLLEEALFTLAFLLFAGIRSLNPDLWAINLGGEKPMEMAFLNAILRSPYMPPIDPWFAGGYINYYYYGYIIFGALIKLTGIAPSTAFNLAIPTLFALTFGNAFSLVYNLRRRMPVALLGGYFAAIIGNFDGALQLKEQVQAILAHLPLPMFDYWRSSRIIPFTINEFPFWSFLFADLHPHVMNMPITVLMLGIIALFFCSDSKYETSLHALPLYALAAFVFGTLACVNPWDMPVYALLLGAALVMRTFVATKGKAVTARIVSLVRTLGILIVLYGSAYLLYWPFYTGYRQLYVNGLGFVTQGSSLGDYLTINGLWIFLALSFFLLELYRWWTPRLAARMVSEPATRVEVARHVAGYLLLCGVVLTFVALLGLKTLLIGLIALGVFLFVVQQDAGTRFTYLLLLMGLCISLGVEVVYVRDFLDGGIYARMNTVFKFSIQAWFCFAIGGALVVQRLWQGSGGFVKRTWLVIFALLMVGNSLFVLPGTLARIHDHQLWVQWQPPAQSANYIPTLDGSAFMRAWYPGDADAIAWMNENISGSPVVLEAAAPYSFSWFSRVSVYTGLPGVLGWPDHVGEQRTNDQVLNRLTDVGIIYTTPNVKLAILLLRYYHVRYIYVGQLERDAYAQQSTAGLDKFDKMVGKTLRLVYRYHGVTIYEVIEGSE